MECEVKEEMAMACKEFSISTSDMIDDADEILQSFSEDYKKMAE
jgi:hypothetical protein